MCVGVLGTLEHAASSGGRDPACRRASSACWKPRAAHTKAWWEARESRHAAKKREHKPSARGLGTQLAGRWAGAGGEQRPQGMWAGDVGREMGGRWRRAASLAEPPALAPAAVWRRSRRAGTAPTIGLMNGSTLSTPITLQRMFSARSSRCTMAAACWHRQARGACKGGKLGSKQQLQNVTAGSAAAVWCRPAGRLDADALMHLTAKHRRPVPPASSPRLQAFHACTACPTDESHVRHLRACLRAIQGRACQECGGPSPALSSSEGCRKRRSLRSRLSPVRMGNAEKPSASRYAMPHPVCRLLTRSGGRAYSPARGGSGGVRQPARRRRCGRCSSGEQPRSAGPPVLVSVPRIVLKDAWAATKRAGLSTGGRRETLVAGTRLCTAPPAAVAAAIMCAL